MEKRDYLIYQIQEMGAFLARLVSKLRKKEDAPSARFSAVSSALKNELSLDLSELLFLDNESFIIVVENKLKSPDNLEQLAALLEQLGDLALNNETFLRQQLYYSKSLFLLSYLDENSQTYSVERQTVIAGIQQKLS